MNDGQMIDDDTQKRVIANIEAVFRNKGLTPPALGPETPFDRSLGLQSLDFAEVVSRLEDEFGTDPFTTASVWEIRTVGDLVALYRG